MALAFAVLGPLQVTHGDAPVVPGGPRERVLLAALLAEHGRVVSVDRLAQALWGEHPPATARRQVAICVYRLRRAFLAAGAGPGVIATCAPGYVVRDGWLDARCFSERAVQARAARSAGDLREAVALLRAALSLWRGPAYAGIDRPFAEVEAARLEEQRLLLTEERIGLELDFGRHEELAGELLALVQAHPLRERLRGLLMVALYRTGQRAEALAVYRDGRRLLIETQGIEPGPELRAIHQALLTDDLAGTRAGGAGPVRPGSVAPVPAQLPPDVTGFTGRRAELKALDALAAALGTRAGGSRRRPLPIGILTGVAGVGKTGLALHWAHRVLQRFPDGQLYADLRGYDAHHEPMPPSAVLDGFLRALGTPGELVPAGQDERAALFRSMTHGKRVLVVLDNARTAAQVLPLLPGSESCFVLVSSRDRLDDLVAGNGARLYALDVLSRSEAGALLTRVAGQRVDPVTADRIAALCDRLPLALRIAAARLAVRPPQAVTDLVHRLAGEQRRLSELSQTDQGVRVSFALSYRELPGPAALLFRLLGLTDAADFAAWTAAALLGCPETQTEDLLDQLVRAGLLEVAGADPAGQVRYRLHDLMRLYARERGLADDGGQARDAAVRRFFGAALDLAAEADRCLGNPFVFPVYGSSGRHRLEDGILSRVRAGPAAWFEAERMVLAGMVAQACTLGMVGYAWELTSALGQFFATRRYTDAWRDCAALAVAAARTAGDERGEAAALLQHADRQSEAGRPGDALRSMRRALALATRCGDNEVQAICWTAMAFTHREVGQVARAQADAERALAMLGRSAPSAARGRALVALGVIHLDQGRSEDAAACFTRFLRIQQAAGSVRGLAEARYRLGTARLRQGRYAAAARLLTVAMHTARQSGDLMTAMLAQIRLGQALIEMRRFDAARPLLDEAVHHVTAEASPRFRAIALEALGRLHAAQGRPGAAAPLLIEAQGLRRALAASAR